MRRREGSTVLDAPFDRDQRVGSDRGADPDVGEEILHGLDDPVREALLRESLEDEGVVDRVKSFTIVREENKEHLLFSPMAVKLFVERKNVVSRLTPGQEHLLVRPNKVLGSINQASNNSTGDDPIVGVTDANGTGVGDEVSKLLREEDKTGSVILPHVILLSPQKRSNAQEQGPSNVGENFIG
jgi:hypothetical protein